jgi:glycogen synthase
MSTIGRAAMIPCLIKEQNCFDDFYKDMSFVLTIHNPAFKGMIDRYFLNDFYGFPMRFTTPARSASKGWSPP